MKKKYELNCCFQESWVTKLPWENFVIAVDGKLTQVKCEVYNVMERWNKLLMPKLDFCYGYMLIERRPSCVCGCDSKGFLLSED